MLKKPANLLESRVLLSATMADTPRTRIRQRIKRLLEDRGRTQRDFAKFLGHGDQWASNLLRGEFTLSLDELDRTAQFFGVPPGEIVRVSEEPWELSPTEMRVVRALRTLPPPVRDTFAQLADWTIGVLPDELDLLMIIRRLDDDGRQALSHWAELKTVEQAHARTAPDRADLPSGAGGQPAAVQKSRGRNRTR